MFRDIIFRYLLGLFIIKSNSISSDEKLLSFVVNNTFYILFKNTKVFFGPINHNSTGYPAVDPDLIPVRKENFLYSFMT